MHASPLVAGDQLQRVAEQVDAFEIDRGDAGDVGADQPNRIVASADARLEHGEFAFGLLEIQAGQRELSLEGTEGLMQRVLLEICDGGGHAQDEGFQQLVIDGDAVDLEALVEAIEMR